MLLMDLKVLAATLSHEHLPDHIPYPYLNMRNKVSVVQACRLRSACSLSCLDAAPRFSLFTRACLHSFSAGIPLGPLLSAGQLPSRQGINAGWIVLARILECEPLCVVGGIKYYRTIR